MPPTLPIGFFTADDNRIVGYGNAMWMISTGCRVGAQRALQMGLVQELVPVGQALARAREIAQELADLPQAALVADRRGVVASTDRSLQAGIDYEAAVGRRVMRDPDVVERLTKYNQRRGSDDRHDAGAADLRR